jgi:hypothetical protein
VPGVIYVMPDRSVFLMAWPLYRAGEYKPQGLGARRHSGNPEGAYYSGERGLVSVTPGNHVFWGFSMPSLRLVRRVETAINTGFLRMCDTAGRRSDCFRRTLPPYRNTLSQ